MAVGKYRSLQQQVDSKAVAVLRVKTPVDLVFRSQPEEDFGVDCEFELFKAIPGSEPKQENTGIIFKGQIKGTAEAQEKLDAAGEKLAFSFSMADAHYWYEQLSIPVILFLVDVVEQTVYWTDFFSNEDFRTNYANAKTNEQKSVTVHFDRKQTFPDSFEQLIRAVNKASERIALRVNPSLLAITEHVQDQSDWDAEVRRAQEQLAVKRYAQLLNAVRTSDFSASYPLAANILVSTECEVVLKACTVRTMQTFAISGPTQDDFLNRIFVSLKLIDLAAPTMETTTFGDLFVHAIRACATLRQLTTRIHSLSLSSRLAETSEANIMAHMMATSARVEVTSLWRRFRVTTEELASRVSNRRDEYVNIAHVCAFVAPLICEAISPLLWLAHNSGDTERLVLIQRYCRGWLEPGLTYCAAVNDQVLGETIVKSAALYLRWTEPRAEVRQRLSELMGNSHESWLSTYDIVLTQLDLAEAAAAKRAEISRDVEWIEELAKKALEDFGIDVTAFLSGDDSSDEHELASHVRKAFSELDLTDYLAECTHRCVMPFRFGGTPRWLEAVGLGFAGHWKQVGCLKKQVLSTSVSFLLRDTLATFREENCIGCEQMEARPKSWQFSYEYLRMQMVDAEKIFPRVFGIDDPSDT